MTDTRMHVLAPLSSPDWNPTSESYGMPWDDATARVDRLIAETRATTLREAADDLDADAARLGPDYHRTAGLRSAADLLRAKADEIHPT